MEFVKGVAVTNSILSRLSVPKNSRRTMPRCLCSTQKVACGAKRTKLTQAQVKQSQNALKPEIGAFRGGFLRYSKKAMLRLISCPLECSLQMKGDVAAVVSYILCEMQA